MRSARSHLSILCLVVGLTGCITIEEQYSFKKNGSGTMTYVLDMSEMGEMLKSFGGDEKDDSDGVEGRMDVSGHADALKQIQGISKVKLDTKKEWVQKLSFHFADIAALNRALNTIMPDSADVAHEFFRWEDGTLVRTTNNYVHDISKTMAEETPADEPDAEEEDGGFDLSSMLGMMKYKYTFKFQKSIDRTDASSAMAMDKPGSKEVSLSTDWAAIAKDPRALDLRIVLNK